MIYQRETNPDIDEMIALYRRSTLAERRPLDDRAIAEDMFHHANLIITARDRGALIGVARTMTDFTYVGYLADLAVDVAFQRQGIGTELIRETRKLMGPRSSLVLLAAPAAVDYYPKIGFTHVPSAWILRASDPL